jgi:hypothetical protein
VRAERHAEYAPALAEETALKQRKTLAIESFGVNKAAAADKGPESLAQFFVDYIELMNSTVNGLKDIEYVAKEAFKNFEIKNHLLSVTLASDLRTHLFRKNVKRLIKNKKDADRKATNREQKKAQTIVQPLNLFDFSAPAVNVNNLISAEAKSLKGDK